MLIQDWETLFLSNSLWRFSCSGVEEFSWYCWSWCEVPYIIVFWSGESCCNNNSSFPPFFLGVALYLEIAQSVDFDAPSQIELIKLGLCFWPSLPTTYFLALIESFFSREEVQTLCPNTLERIQLDAPLNKVWCSLQSIGLHTWTILMFFDVVFDCND